MRHPVTGNAAQCKGHRRTASEAKLDNGVLTVKLGKPVSVSNITQGPIVSPTFAKKRQYLAR